MSLQSSASRSGSLYSFYKMAFQIPFIRSRKNGNKQIATSRPLQAELEIVSKHLQTD